MGLKKGAKRNPESGRKKGTPNKRTLELQEKLEILNLHPLEGLVTILPDLDPDQKAHVYLSLMPYLYPKRKSIEINYEDEQKLRQIAILDTLSVESIKNMIQEAIQHGKTEIEV